MRSFRRTFHHLQDLLKRTDIRDHAILMLLAMYGVRSEEVARLRISDVDWSETEWSSRVRRELDDMNFLFTRRWELQSFITLRKQGRSPLNGRSF
jgi:integrase